MFGCLAVVASVVLSARTAIGFDCRCFLAQPRVFYALSMHDLLPRRLGCNIGHRGGGPLQEPVGAGFVIWTSTALHGLRHSGASLSPEMWRAFGSLFLIERTGLLLIACGALLPFSTLANAISGGVCAATSVLAHCSLLSIQERSSLFLP